MLKGRQVLKWRQCGPVLVGLLLFALWTLVVRVGISEGSRQAAWRSRPFGTWPSSFGTVAGSGNLELSIYVSYTTGGTVGYTTVGTTTDSNDSGNMNGSRYVTGSEAGSVGSMSVYVAGPVDPPPQN